MRDYGGVHLVVPPGGSFRETRNIELGPRVLTIGCAPTCDIQIDVPGVDDEHAKISEVSLIAVGNDCAVGDVPLDNGQRRLVMPGDEIQIGSVVLVLDGVDPSLADDPGAARRNGPRIRVVEGHNFGDDLVLAAENREYVIGRSPKADLVLEDREVSREHLKIVRRGNSVFLFDQASTRGSWLGRSAVYQGTRIEWQRPRMLKVGATVLSLDLPDDGRRRVPAAVASAPMTAPVKPQKDKLKLPAQPTDDAGPPPDSIVAYHYQAKAPVSSSGPDSSVPSSAGPHRTPGTPGISPSVPPPAILATPSGGRAAWKKEGTAMSRTTGLLLLALGGIAILAALFVVFNLMD